MNQRRQTQTEERVLLETRQACSMLCVPSLHKAKSDPVTDCRASETDCRSGGRRLESSCAPVAQRLARQTVDREGRGPSPAVLLWLKSVHVSGK